MDLPEIKYALRRTRPENNVITFHSHGSWELICYLGGQGRVETERKIYTYSENNILLLPPHHRHSESNISQTELVFVVFDAGSIECREGMYTGDGELSSLAARIAADCRSGREGDIVAARLYLQILLLKLSDRRGGSYQSAGRQNPSLESAFRYICDYYNTDIRLDELAASVGYSADRFRHIFKEKFGISPKQLIIYNRLNAAKRMLMTDEKIETVARACGFGSASQFNVLFRNAERMTPGEYRRREREKKDG